MEKSNVIVGSNVYHSKKEDPRQDSDFVAQIEDVERLKKIKEARKADHRIAELQESQEKMLKNDLRCVYCKNDPCYGYVKELGRVVCKCINGDCPKIKRDNPDYTDQYALEWKANDEDVLAYGFPEDLNIYYLVNLPSSEELNCYETMPKNSGENFKMLQKLSLDGAKAEKAKLPETRIDPATGRIQMIVGFGDWKINDNASYESEELPPIWGFVEDYIERNRVSIKKTKKIQKKNTGNKYLSEKEILLSDLFLLAMDITSLDIILDNPAELSSMSSILLNNEIDHGFGKEAKVRLILKDSLETFHEGRIGIFSSTILGHEDSRQNDKAWKQFELYDTSYVLSYASRQYYNYFSDFGKNRWCCKNMYEVTHICIEREDIQELKELSDGMYPVYLKRDKSSFIIRRAGSFEREIGSMTEQFYRLIAELVKKNEVATFPEKIDEINFKIYNGEINILGMGHLVIN